MVIFLNILINMLHNAYAWELDNVTFLFKKPTLYMVMKTNNKVITSLLLKDRGATYSMTIPVFKQQCADDTRDGLEDLGKPVEQYDR